MTSSRNISPLSLNSTTLTRRTVGLLGLSTLALPHLASAKPGTWAADPYRPSLHYAPSTGFMNDPNGLVFYEGEYHLFYQFNPYQPRAGHVHWGHAVSPDLLHWRTLPVALSETAAGQAFSGSAVIDRTNTSGLFPTNMPGGLVTVYTRAAKNRQTQEIATSTDRGRTFVPYSGNPVLDIGSDQFRDPKVFWHEATSRWTMVVVRSREHRVVFYASLDLKHWEETGLFDRAGLLGIDYECPDLVELPVQGGGNKWVLFVSINPGAPLGGSCVQYFVGDFNGRNFVADDAAVRLADFGKDFYALQTFTGVAEPVGIAWMSNWQYCNDTPTGTWRGVMTLPRRLSLRRREGDWRLVQQPVDLDSLTRRLLLEGARPAREGQLAFAALPTGEPFDLALTIDATPSAVTVIRLSNAHGEVLQVGFDAGPTASVFIDRGRAKGFQHRFFTDKTSWAAPAGTSRIDLRLIIDRCTLEVFALDGEASGTMLQFFGQPPDRLEIMAEGGPVALPMLRLSMLSSAMGLK